MNYWPAEVYNLAECHQPLFDMIKDLAVTGAKTARVYYSCGGWVPITTPISGAAPRRSMRPGTACGPSAAPGSASTSGNTTPSPAIGSSSGRYYPILKGSAQFLLELLVEDPKHHWLVTPFSMSPEHGYYDETGSWPSSRRRRPWTSPSFASCSRTASRPASCSAWTRISAAG